MYTTKIMPQLSALPPVLLRVFFSMHWTSAEVVKRRKGFATPASPFPSWSVGYRNGSALASPSDDMTYRLKRVPASSECACCRPRILRRCCRSLPELLSRSSAGRGTSVVVREILIYLLSYAAPQSPHSKTTAFTYLLAGASRRLRYAQ